MLKNATRATALTSVNEPPESVNCGNVHLSPLSHMPLDMSSTKGQGSSVNVIEVINDGSMVGELGLNVEQAMAEQGHTRSSALS